MAGFTWVPVGSGRRVSGSLRCFVDKLSVRIDSHKPAIILSRWWMEKYRFLMRIFLVANVLTIYNSENLLLLYKIFQNFTLFC